MKKRSNWIEGHIREQEGKLLALSDLINEQGETTPDVQAQIDKALFELENWKEMREMFE